VLASRGLLFAAAAAVAANIYMYICMYVFVYLCMYVFIYA